MAGNLNELIFIKRVKKHPHEHAHGGQGGRFACEPWRRR